MNDFKNKINLRTKKLIIIDLTSFLYKYQNYLNYIKKKYPNAEQRAWRDNNHKYAIYIKVSPKIMKRAILICLKAETRRHKAEIKRLRKL